MIRYSIYYGVFHWLIHFLSTIVLLVISGIVIFPNSPSIMLGSNLKLNIFDILAIFLFSSLVDLDHLKKWKILGPKGALRAQKIIPDPIHNFFFLSVFAVTSVILVLFFSKIFAVLLFSIVLHLMWDFVEDVTLFGISYRRWQSWLIDNDAEVRKLAKQLKKE